MKRLTNMFVLGAAAAVLAMGASAHTMKHNDTSHMQASGWPVPLCEPDVTTCPSPGSGGK